MNSGARPKSGACPVKRTKCALRTIIRSSGSGNRTFGGSEGESSIQVCLTCAVGNGEV